MPSSIKSIASDPFSYMVAIGREDGDIEISDSSNKWHTIAYIPGQADFELRTLVWSTIEEEKGRLFGISQKGFIFEVDLSQLSFKNVQESYGGAAWCISTSSTHATLAVGCEDGSSRLFSYKDGDLRYAKTHPTTGSRILSICYHPVKPQLYLGCSDGTVRCIESESGRSRFRITGDLVRGATTMIWSLIVLSDSTVVTGDNRGHVQLWDGEAGVLMVSFHQHTAEVLALAVSPDESHVFASGVDSRVTCIQRMRNRSRSGSNLSAATKFAGAEELSPVNGQWVYTTSHRPHSHDVYALAVSKKGSAQPLLLSGGMDCKLCVYSIGDFASVRPVWVLPIPASGITSASSSHDIVALRHRRHIDIWSLYMQGSSDDTEDPCKLLLRMQMESPEHIHCMALSPNGSLLVVSGAFGTKLWYLQKVSGSESVKLISVSLPEAARHFCHAVCFSEDSSQLAVSTAKGLILLLKLQPELAQADVGGEAKGKKNKNKRHGDSNSITGFSVSLCHTLNHWDTTDEIFGKYGGAQGLEYAVSSLSLSQDGMFLAVANCMHSVCVYELDRSRLYWRLPISKSSGPIANIAFNSEDNSKLVLLYSTGGFCVYTLENMTMSDWSIESTNNSGEISKVMQKLSGSMQGLCFDPLSTNRMFIHGQGVCMFVDLSANVPKNPKLVFPSLFDGDDVRSKQEGKKESKKRKAGSSASSSSNFSSTTSYRSIIHLGCVHDQLVSRLPSLVPYYSFLSCACATYSGPLGPALLP